MECRDANEDIMTLDIKKQARQLISKPLQQLKLPVSGPIVCVIDGLDACADASDASLLAFLKCFSGSDIPLPPWLKIFVTSRPIQVLEDQDVPFGHHNFNSDHPDNRADVSMYIKHRINSAQLQKRRGPLARTLLTAIEKESGVLFRSAQIALDMLEIDPSSDVGSLVKYLFRNQKNDPSENSRLLEKRIESWKQSSKYERERLLQRLRDSGPLKGF